MNDDVDDLLDSASAGERRALGRLLTIAERGADHDGQFETTVRSRRAHPARVVGITGSPGVGKSTLTGRLLDAIAGANRRAAVLAVDPSSPRSGGAILGDRIRMGHADDRATFIRSVATRGTRGGLAASIPAMVRVFEAAGFDTVIIETVGVGQVELEVAGLADTTVVVVTPGWGDSIQANKAGILEVADVFAVNKADRAGADDAVRDLEHMLDLTPGVSLDPPAAKGRWRPPIVRTIATDGTGIDDLLAAIDLHGSRHADGEHEGSRRERAELRSHVERDLAKTMELVLSARPDLLAAIESGTMTTATATRQVLADIGDRLTVNRR